MLLLLQHSVRQNEPMIQPSKGYNQEENAFRNQTEHETESFKYCATRYKWLLQEATGGSRQDWEAIRQDESQEQRWRAAELKVTLTGMED